jgi:aryl-alcohol dehydrogenase-like predicted oxidoreductase
LTAVRLILGTASLAGAGHRLLDEFYAGGGRGIDLANVYGDGASEAIVGEWLRTRGLRDDMALYVKGCHPPVCDPKLVAREVGFAAAKLGVDRLDAFLLHRDDLSIAIEEWGDALEVELSSGTVLAVGVSNWTVERFNELRAYLELDGERTVAVFSNHFSLAEMVVPPWPACLALESEALDVLTRSGVTVLAWASLAGGYLAGNENEPATSWDSERNRGRRRRLSELAARLGTSPAAIAIAYVLARDGVRPVIGTRSMNHLVEALEAESIKLSREDVRFLETGVEP